MMITFKTVEDYIEVIAGERDMVTQKPTNSWMSEPIISLARYDKDVVAKMATQTLQSIGYTEKQAALAHKIVMNYRRQLAQKNIDVTPVETPVYRIPIRPMDYSLRLYIEDEMLNVRFPYNQKLIESVRSFSKESQGAVRWNPNKKNWQAALTEYNLNWFYTFAKLNSFEVDTEVSDLMAKVEEVESSDYSIELCVNNSQLELRNAPDSLLEYIKNTVGDLDISNIVKLADLAPILGYTIDANLEEALAREFGFRFVHLLTNRELKIDPASMFETDNFKSVIDYAIQTDRLPVYLYEPDLSGKMLQRALSMFEQEEVLVAKHTSTNLEITDKTKVVHLVKPVRGSHRVPILVSSAGMIYGGEKECMVQAAEKIVYCAADVYNKRNTQNKGIKSLGS